jgi:general secretion pathway protein D
VGLASISVLLSACVSIKDGPGFRKNVDVNPFQRSAAVKELDEKSLNLEHPILKPAKKSKKFQSASSNEDSFVATSASSDALLDNSNSMPVSRKSASQDMELVLGNNQYYRTDVERPSLAMGKASKGDGVALNFERASIREVVGVVLGDILKQTYIVEPGVEGEVTINSSEPIPRESLIPTLESLLQTQGAVLYKDDNGDYRVAARANLKGRGFMPSTGKIKPGYNIQVVPLRYIPVTEMQKILEPIASPDAFVRVDANRNLLVLAGTSSELRNLMATVKTFDVDVLQGMSVGIYRIKNVEAQVVAKNLDALFGESGNSPMAGMVKIMPIEHMNSLMIISASPDYLKEMKGWVDRFDQTGPVDGQQLFVYHVQNGSAEHLAEMLTQIFSGKSGSKKSTSSTAPSSLAPGLESATVGGSGDSAGAPAAALKTMIGGTSGVNIDPDADVKIVADKTNNSLMILSSEAMYKQIQEALKRIDIMPMQVQVEASIMEITLSDEMSNGLQWYLTQNGNTFGELGVGKFGANATPNGFSFTLAGGSSGIKGFIHALAKESKVKVISSPSVLVLDNQTAEIRVGDQQPIKTGSVSTDGTVSSIQSIQYKDTGVALNVTPHVNSNGLVKMDVQQDITDVGEIDSATGQRTFLKRNIKSNIAVQSGETIVLGGLIRDNQTHGNSGVPVLKNLPVIGNAFNGSSKSGKRTELLVLITPTAIKDQADLVQTGNEMRDRMKRLMDNNTFIQQLRGEYVE